MLDPAVTELAITAFVTMFVIIDPIGVLSIFIGLTRTADIAYQRRMAIKGTLIGGAILTFFALFGAEFLSLLGVGIPAFRIAGGVMVFLIALEMVFDKRIQRRENRAEEMKSDPTLDDISVFPLAVPLISGPGAIASIMLLIGRAKGDLMLQSTVFAVLASVLLICLCLFMLAGPLSRILGQTFTHTLSRVLGVILAALAVQFILDGIRNSLMV
ncbi:MarC family protein [Sneathiella chinensis]|uniref:UPF0056 membrane protein n=1 Tax=Sneathiella chinensis TaxID=349750 RepID=A0ABQ5TZ84_9PROT|nr:MarC family protein [Sneathiella chinensis]GLQ04798.1 UPF0056 inner membrane protein [Sneathiella chinensis]